QTLDKSLAADGVHPGSNHLISLEAAFCVQARRFNDAKKALEQTPDGLLEISAVTQMGLKAQDVRGAAFALGSGDASADAVRARTLAADGKRKEAIEA